ncbi:MAG TPA: FtsQ-type POTRA domain-containing protein [Gemmatimonadaceae bacterium]|nr:FtsQ-type POTRA domain-containing protein [Gemmatimonadaceae bacterium]
MTEPLPVEPEAPLPRPPRRWRVIALLLLVILLAPASWLARKGASRMDFFRLKSVAVEGTRYLSGDSVMKRLAVDTTRSVWDDTGPLIERIRSMPQVSEVEIRRRLPGTLVVSIHENLPIALAPSPRGLEPVDSAGRVLPIDPSIADIDLPIANQRDKAVLSLLSQARSENPVVYHRISEISRDGKDGIIIRLAPALQVRALLGVSVERLSDIFPVESDLIRRRANVAELDLRYRDQVIARLQ